MAIELITTKATRLQIDQVLPVLKDFIKVAVDVRREVLPAGCALHSDCESVLLANGSAQEAYGVPTGIRITGGPNVKPS